MVELNMVSFAPFGLAWSFASVREFELEDPRCEVLGAWGGLDSIARRQKLRHRKRDRVAHQHAAALRRKQR